MNSLSVFTVLPIYGLLALLLIIIVSTMMEEGTEVNFSKDLHHYLTMAIEIWPTLKSALRHLPDLTEQHVDSFLPKRNYSAMEETHFMTTITEDLFDFIMTHEVKSEDVEDYLDDILDLMMVDEELAGGNRNPASIRYMANHTVEVITELQNGKKDKLIHF